MPIYETYAKRRKAEAKSGQVDVFSYDEIPTFLRRQISNVFNHTIGSSMSYSSKEVWDAIDKIISQEVESYPVDVYSDGRGRVLKFIGTDPDIDNFLSMIELACVVFSVDFKDDYSVTLSNRGATQTGANAVAEINARFREHGLGYEYQNGRIMRVDNEFIHSNVIKPALSLLHVKGFEKANEDFRTAHKHYRSGENKDAIVAVNRSFESALKAICSLRDWEFEAGARASDLIKLVRAKGLFGGNMEAGLDAFVAMLKTGVPGIRNTSGGHGSSPNEPAIKAYLAAYALDMAASNIVMVVKAHQSMDAS